MKSDEPSDLLRRIREWNATRLDLFKISEPNRRNEFNGVVRFFFQGDDGKYQSKCLRISNAATACQLVNILVEKFHPDLKMLTAGRYALYEYHSTSGERRLGANEAPLLVQLNWAFDEREIRFILRDESKPLPSARSTLALEKQPGALLNGIGKHRSNQRPDQTADGQPNRSFARRWSSGSRKKKKKSTNGDIPTNGSVPDAVPDSTFTRTLSNPDEVLRRRRQQRARNREQNAGDEKTNNLKIYGDTLNSELPYITLQLGLNDTAETVVLWTLEKYGLSKQADPHEYCIVQMNIPPRGERLPMEVQREITLHHHDCPLRIKAQLAQRDGVSCIFQIRHRTIPSRDGRRLPPPPSVHPRFPPQQTRSRSSGPHENNRTGHSLIPYLIEVKSEKDQEPCENGIVAPLIDLFDRIHVGPIKLGTIEKMVGPPPNILVDRMQHQDIRPVHCTFSMVQASTSASRLRIPRAGPSADLDGNTYQSLLVSPSLDGFAKPPGPAVMRVNGTRITGPMLLSPDSVVQLGKSLLLKFVYSDIDWAETETDDGSKESEPLAATAAASFKHGSTARLANTLPPNVLSGAGKQVCTDPNKTHSSQPPPELRRPPPSRENGLNRLSRSESDDLLPLSIELRGTDNSNKASLLDRYVHLVDQILTHTRSDLDAIINRTRSDKTATFTLSPAYAFYLVYRAFRKHLNVLAGINPSEKDHQISYITNYIATRVYESLPSASRDEGREQLDHLYPLVYWLANSSELLHFFKNDVDLCSPDAGSTSGPGRPSKMPQSPIHVSRQALHLLADCVDHCFHQLRACMTGLMNPLLCSLVYPGDSDLQDEIRLDDRSITTDNYFINLREPIKFQALMQLLTLFMHHLRRTRVNASLTIQLFSQLFHALNAYMFNQVLINTEAKPRGTRQDDTNVWLTRNGATRLLRRLDRIKQWAQRQGLERAAECRLQRCVQACQLILADRSNLDEFYQFCMGLLSLNSMQLEWLMAHLVDPPPVPDDWIDLIVTGGKEVNDRAIADEMEHLMHSARDSPLVPEIQLTEPRELPLPLLLPPDGYASDTILTGAPTGLVDFFRPLESKRLIHVCRNTVDGIRINQRPWTNYLRLIQNENKENRLSDTGTYQSNPMLETDPIKTIFQRPTTTRDSETSESSSDDDDHDDDDDGDDKNCKGPGRSGQSHRGRYKPAPMSSGFGSLKRPVQHRSLPDLTMSEFEHMAWEARVPVDSIIRFYLRKYNNSLGLSIVAAKAEGQKLYGIYVKEIVPGGAAARDGRLSTGDQILAIGSSSLIGCAQSDAVGTIAKQSRSDAGIQLTVARGAAKHHRILDLIRPTDGSQTVPKASHTSVDPNTKSKHSPQPPTSFADMHQSEDPVDRKRALVQKIGSPVLPPSTRVGVRQTEEVGLRHPAAGALGRRFGRDSGPGHQSGSLSRSTPSLNLAEVGVDDTESNDSPSHRPTHGFQSKSEQHNQTKSPSDKQKASQRPQSKPSQKQSTSHHSSSSRSRSSSKTSSDPSSRSASRSSGSDIVHDPPPSNRPPTGNRRPPAAAEQRKPQGFSRRGRQRNPSGTIQGSRSQPDIATKTVPLSEVPKARRVSLTNGAEPKIPVAESVSDEFSSLDSISSEQTPCSLHDSGTDQPHIGGGPTKANVGVSGTFVGEEKTRHPPPPIVPSQKAPNRTFAHQRHASESELMTTAGVDNSNLGRPVSAVHRDWPETDVDAIETNARRLKTGSLDVKKMNSMDSVQPNHAAFGSHDKIGGTSERPKSQEHGSRTNLATPGTSGSMTPTSMDTVIAGQSTGPDSIPSYQSSPQRLPIPAQPAGSKRISSPPVTGVPGIPTVADVSHRAGLNESSNKLDEPISETLKPPSHAVVHTTRWNDDRLPTFAPELLPDLPILHRDPHRGRTRSGSADISNDVPTMSTIRADCAPTTPTGGNTIQGLPPRPYPAISDTSTQNSRSPTSISKPAVITSAQTGSLASSIPNTYVPRVPVHLPGSSFASPPPTPTADCPQYHPPERLQPVDWTNSGRNTGEARMWSDRPDVGANKAPKVAPKPHVTVPFSYHQPSKSLPSPSLPPSRPESDVFLAPKSHTDAIPSHSLSHSPSPTAMGGIAGLSAAQKVSQLEAELRMLESKPGSARPEELDRLRVELQFQRRLADRESLRRYAPDDPYVRPRADSSPVFHNLGTESRVTSTSWEEKRSQAERELEAAQNRRLAELEREHQTMLLRQQQRAKERSQWFEQHRNRANGTPTEKNVEITTNPDTHGRYGRPRFDPSQSTVQSAPQHPIQTRIGPQVVESELTRSGDSLRVKKSVSFDKNLEIISVYSPPTTPQDSVAENVSAVPPRGTTTVVDQTHSNGPNRTTFFPSTAHEPANPRYQSYEGERFHSMSKSSSSGNVAKSSPYPTGQSGGGTTVTVNLVDNAELLPFKEKMRLFAQQIGEEPPKERSRISNLQRQLLTTGTTGTNGQSAATRMTPVNPNTLNIFR